MSEAKPEVNKYFNDINYEAYVRAFELTRTLFSNGSVLHISKTARDEEVLKMPEEEEKKEAFRDRHMYKLRNLYLKRLLARAHKEIKAIPSTDSTSQLSELRA